MTWITSSQAAAILAENSGREISTAYVRTMARDGLIRSRVNPKDASTNQYWEEDVKERKVRLRTEKRVEQRVRDRRSGRPGGRPRKKQPAAKEEENHEPGSQGEPLALAM